jgi:acetyltransferase-like isoleucine patch superfamily enzyme
VKKLLMVFITLAPASRIKNFLLAHALGWEVGSESVVHPILVLGVGEVRIGRRVRIGPGNVIRDLTEWRMDDNSRLGQWNWISASRPLIQAGGAGVLHIGKHSAVTSRHYFDCSGGLRIGQYSTVAGVRSTALTHGIDWKASKQTTRGITIGDHCLISSNVSLPPGSTISDRTVVGMGTTVGMKAGDGPGLWIGPRATRTKNTLEGAYFERTEGYVYPAHTEGQHESR